MILFKLARSVDIEFDYAVYAGCNASFCTELANGRTSA